jgi:GT2 family glycosyltransferase
VTVRATVVIVSWNGAALLRRCLPALRAQTLPDGATFDTVVVDNASADDTLSLLDSDFPWARVVRNSENLGFAGGNNSALRDVSTPFAVLLNNDAVPEPGWLEALLAPFDEAGGEQLAITTGKVLFAPRFAQLQLSTPGFSPGPQDTRELGVQVHRVELDGTDVTGNLLWDSATYGQEAGFRWTRPDGEILLPLDGEGPWKLSLVAMAERPKAMTLAWRGGTVSASIPAGEPGPVQLELPAGLPVVDVVNNAGGVFLDTGYGADRGFQRIDDGRYDSPREVFAGCGNGMAVRTEVGHEAGWFDEGFFLYYEDTDLSWRIRSRGWQARYVPTAVLRHEHAASSGENSELFTFHVERNRLLCLVTNATVGLALREVFRYPVTTASMVRHRAVSRAALRLRIRIMLSFLRLLPRALWRRARIGHAARTGRTQLQSLFTTYDSWLGGTD